MPGRMTSRSRRRTRPAEARRSGIPHITAVLIGLFFLAQAGFMASLFRMARPPSEPATATEEAAAGPETEVEEPVTR